jgi:mRNA deadenylase 3'-5' endonuclease subunit Ccr4
MMKPEQFRVIFTCLRIIIVVAGDFNMTPQSLLYQFMVEGMIKMHDHPNHRDTLCRFMIVLGSMTTFNQEEWRYSGQLVQEDNSLKKLVADVDSSSIMVTTTMEMGLPEELDTDKPSEGKTTTLILEQQSESISTPVSSNPQLHQHSFQFCSAYDDTHDRNRYSTTYHDGFQGMVDYIFYTKGHLHLRGFLQLVNVDETKIMGPLPNVLIPSDHLPLMSCFEFI